MKRPHHPIAAPLSTILLTLLLSACMGGVESPSRPELVTGPDVGGIVRDVADGATAQPRDDEDPFGDKEPAPREDSGVEGDDRRPPRRPLPEEVVPGKDTVEGGRPRDDGTSDPRRPRADESERVRRGEGIDPIIGERGKDGVADEAARPTFDITSVRDVEMRFLLERARREMEAGNLEEADKTLSFALERDSGSAEARAMRDEVRLLLSKAAPGAANPIERERQVTLEEYEVEARKLMDAAEQAMDAARYADAARHYSRILELIRFAPYKDSLKGRFEAKARAGLHAAETKSRQVRLEEELQQQDEARKLAALKEISRENTRREIILELWREAIYELELRHFDRGEELVDRILAMDPNFKMARNLKQDIQTQRLEGIRRETFERMVLGYRKMMTDFRAAMVPDTRLVVYPTGSLAKRIMERKSKLSDTAAIGRDGGNVIAKLESIVIPLEFDEVPLRQVITSIREKSGLNIILDNAVDGSYGDSSVTLSLQSMPLSDGLSLLLSSREPPLSYIINGSVLKVVDSAGAAAQEEKITRVHDVRDITFQLKDFQAPKLNLRSASQQNPGPQPPPQRQESQDTDAVRDSIETAVRSGSWGSNGTALRVFGGQLVATHTAAAHAEIRSYLADLRRVAGLLVEMRARFLSVTDDFLTEFGIDFRGLGGPAAVPNQSNLVLEDVTGNAEDNAGGAFDNGSGGVPQANPSAGIFFNNTNPAGPVNFNRDIRGRFENIFDGALGSRLSSAGGLAMQLAIFQNLTQLNMVVRAIEKTSKARTLVEPRLSAFNTQRANIAMITQIPYVQDFDVRTAASAAIADPVIDVIMDGVVMEVVPTISNDRRFITIEVQPTVMEVLQPIPTFITTLGPTNTVTIQMPQVKLQTVKTTVRVPDGGAVVLGGLKSVQEWDMEAGTPVLSDLPLLGTLFKRRGKSLEQSNLVIILEAKIVDLNDEELRQPGYSGS